MLSILWIFVNLLLSCKMWWFFSQFLCVTERLWSLWERDCCVAAARHARNCYTRHDGEWESVGDLFIIYHSTVSSCRIEPCGCLCFDYISSFDRYCERCFSEVVELGQTSKDSEKQLFANADSKPAIVFPPKITAQWEEQVPVVNEYTHTCGYLLTLRFCNKWCHLPLIMLDKAPLSSLDRKRIRHWCAKKPWSTSKDFIFC